MDEYHLLNKKFNKKNEKSVLKKKTLSFLNQVLISAVLVLLCLIVSKNTTYKNLIYKYIYSYNLSFLEIEEFITKNFGSIIPTNDISEEVVSSFDKFTYEELEEIEGGVNLTVGKDKVINALESGLVIFKGEKDEYGDVLVLEQTDGVEAWYVGVSYGGLELYDYIEKGNVLGSSKDNNISLYFKRRGESVDYKEYLF